MISYNYNYNQQSIRSYSNQWLVSCPPYPLVLKRGWKIPELKVEFDVNIINAGFSQAVFEEANFIIFID